MLTTNERFTQATDPTTGVARPRTCAVTAPAYLHLATIASTAVHANAATTANVWLESGRKAMTKVDFHDRWPLHPTS